MKGVLWLGCPLALHCVLYLQTVSPVTPKKTKTQQSSPLPYGSFTTRVASSTPSRQRREYSQETEAEQLMPPPPPDVDMESMSATLPRMQKYDSGMVSTVL